MKWVLSLCLSLILWLVGCSIFSFGSFDCFFWFFHSVTLLDDLRQRLILAENWFLLISEQKKGARYSILFFVFFLKFCHLIFLKTVRKENYCDTWLPIESSMSGKIRIKFELSFKMLLIDQIAWFLKF